MTEFLPYPLPSPTSKGFSKVENPFAGDGGAQKVSIGPKADVASPEQTLQVTPDQQ